MKLRQCRHSLNIIIFTHIFSLFPSYSIILFVQKPMFEKTQTTCDCLGVTIFTPQKPFLSRKLIQQQQEKAQQSRRVIKSNQMKNSMHGKGKKKSLKKRTRSSLHSDNNHSNLIEFQKQHNIKENSMAQTTFNKKNSLQKSLHISNFTPRNMIKFNYSSVESSYRGSKLPINHIKSIETNCQNLQIISSEPVSAFGTVRQKEYLKHHLQSTRYHHNSIQNIQFSAHSQKQCQRQSQQKIQRKSSVSAHQITFMEHSKHFTLSQSEKCLRQQNQTSNLPIQNSFVIQDYQKLFPKQQQSKSFKKINVEPKNTHNIRQIHRVKKIQQQKQLQGRLAQSQNQSYQQSLQSQVIGKGFDRGYQENEEFNLRLQTAASHSTFAKISNKKGEKHQSYLQKLKFQNLNLFISRDRF